MNRDASWADWCDGVVYGAACWTEDDGWSGRTRSDGCDWYPLSTGLCWNPGWESKAPFNSSERLHGSIMIHTPGDDSVKLCLDLWFHPGSTNSRLSFLAHPARPSVLSWVIMDDPFTLLHRHTRHKSQSYILVVLLGSALRILVSAPRSPNHPGTPACLSYAKHPRHCPMQPPSLQSPLQSIQSHWLLLLERCIVWVSTSCQFRTFSGRRRVVSRSWNKTLKVGADHPYKNNSRSPSPSTYSSS